MAKLTLSEVLDSMTATKTNKDGEIIYNRFNKKEFNKLLKAMMNDPQLKTQVAKVSKGALESVDEIAVGEGFRKWCRNLVEKAGIDSSDSEVVMTEDFVIDNVDGIYEFIATAIWLYMERGNMFQFIAKEDCNAASIGVKSVKKKVTEREESNPSTRESLGVFTRTSEAHREIFLKNAGTPKWLKRREKK